jgi:hypothetical protein
MMTYSLIATNTDPDSENRMHSDEVATKLGFQSGLVPGVDVFEYMARGALQRFPRWMSGGSGELRLRKPYYDGERVEVGFDEPAAIFSADDRATLQIGADPAEPWHAPAYVPPLEPSERPKASPRALARGTVLRTLRRRFQDSQASALKAREFLELANRILMATVVLEPWIHTGSKINWYEGAASVESVEVRAFVTDLFDRKDHGFVTYRVSYLDADHLEKQKPAACIEHTAIWRFRGRP